ncbi:MAG TPA: poly-beta-1,6-N-acetyl-D-glucosamine biosynthesis protein PgaD, partial [Candidatus Brocadiaceae bacterium]|nr:poly-beta-1,6-N-acetyl-D-glucosamine biosynthesis protein PgaD [Candidatus Brocadiaceae bacterium]
MHAFIIDHFACQRAHKRLLWNTITGLGWAFWIYLWLPLLRAIGMLLAPHHEQATTEAFRSIQELFTTLTTHLSMTVLMIAAFLAWASLQWLVTARRRRTVQKQPIIRLHRVLQFMPDEQHVNTWR